MSIEIANESGAEVDETALAELATFVLAEMGVNPLAELSVLLVDEQYMTSLHERWMGEPGPTDVLAFPMDELETSRGKDDTDEPTAALLGDVVLCPSVAAKQAVTAGHPAEAELHLLATHGILHLLGYDHGVPEEEREMFGLQSRLLSGWARHRAGTPAAKGGRPG